MRATYARLKKENAWGIRIAGNPDELECVQPGQEIDVVTKAGLIKTELISEIAMRFDDAIYCRIENKNA